MEKIFEQLREEINFEFPKDTEFIKDEKVFSVACKNNKVIVRYSKNNHIMRAGLIVKANGINNDYNVIENNVFEDLCLMVDCSRNAVRNVETVKKTIRNLAMLGYNSLMLYTEDTYEVDGEPMFGYLRGRYTKSELKELNDYALELGIELIPCIQTLAHLNQLQRYAYSHFKCFDCFDILLVGEERTYDLIDKMFKTLSECYTSKKIHVGMDEAWLLGRGVYQDRNGCISQFEVIMSHLTKVCELAEKYGFKPIIWSDMFYRLAEKDDSCKDKRGNLKFTKEIINKVPQNLSLCHWDYHNVKAKDYYDKLKLHLQFNNHIWFAGGTTECNRGFIPHLKYSNIVSTAAIKAAKKYKIKSLMETVWGDNGGECSLFALLPAIMHYSYQAIGVSAQRMRKEFKALTGYNYDSFMKLDYAQSFCGKYVTDLGNPAKYGLYSDVFSGFTDTLINPLDKENFKKAKLALSRLRTGQYAYLFESAYALNEVLYLKYDIGVRLRTAYQSRDNAELKSCASDMKKIIKLLDKFIKYYRTQWHTENKPNGLEIQEIRLGGLKERIIGCRETVINYLEGKVKEIPELEEKLIENAVSRHKNGCRADLFSHQAIASVNSFDGFFTVDV